MRRSFQVALLLAAFLPFLLGTMTVFQGAARFVPIETITAAFDGQVRFWGIRSMLPFFLAIWIVRNLDTSGQVLLIVVAATVAGGIARGISVLQYAMPEPMVLGIIAFEVSVFAFVPWRSAVLRREQCAQFA